MTQYMATGADSGHTIIIHGARALADYRASAREAKAEELNSIHQVDLRKHREDHATAADHGLCYGPCAATPRGETK